ncbi:MAG TPA: aspartate--tRNA ligase [Trueperaceae bacterium]
MTRSHMCGELRAGDDGARVVLQGWVNRRRDLGGLVFLDLRDRTGIVQAVVEPDAAEAFEAAESVRSEYVVAVGGAVRLRPESQRGKTPTGDVEVVADSLTVLSTAKTPPFLVDGSVDASEVAEDIRLRYRYLDLRRPEALRPLLLRHQATKAIWDYLDARGFVQVETPMLTLSTPEGARDYVVPSRLSPGTFYALPQSPQLFKQLLMMSGVDRYFQLARCFRDEDLRADRQPDFTQVDIEMSFVSQDDVLELNEGLMAHVVKQTLDRTIQVPFPRLSYREAMDRFGSDKPDRRFGLELLDLTQAFLGSDFKAFAGAVANGGVVKVLAVDASRAEPLSRKVLGDLEELAKVHGAAGLAWLRRAGDGFSGPIAKFLGATERAALERLAPHPGDTLLLAAGSWSTTCTAVGAVRTRLGSLLDLRPDPDELDFLWVVDFPLLDRTEDGGWTYMHHPFARPHDDDLQLLETDPGAVRAYAYDMVLNGNEVGGGSLRIHSQDVQQRMFRAIGIEQEEAARRFGFFLDALSYGVPPHGGIAWGFDRVVMLLAGTASIRDTIAFPKIQRGFDPLTGAPAPVSQEQLDELGLDVRAS